MSCKYTNKSANKALPATNNQNTTAVNAHQKTKNCIILTTPSAETTMATKSSQSLTNKNITNNYLTLTHQATSTYETHQVGIDIAQNKNMTTITKPNTPHTPFELFSHLPKYIGLQIFKHLSPAESACLGLTCSSLYNLHKAIRGVVDLGEYGWVEIDEKWTKQGLSCFLKGWMGSQGFRFEEGMCIFVFE